MHSTLYRGRSFATFPLVVFGLAFASTFLTVKYSTLEVSAIGSALEGLGLFLGLTVGSIGFSSRDAMKNVLGPMNLLVYSSRTLPVSERRLLLDFIVKDVLYYTFLFIAPVTLGVVIPTGTALISSALATPFFFITGLAISLAAARSSLRIPSRQSLSFEKLRSLGPLTSKSVLDLSRSSGGLVKVLFSFTVLFGFYWFAVLYFPVTGLFLTNPLLSFSVIVGVLNLSVYNWVNRFDAPSDYSYLPIDAGSLLEAKKKAYLAISLPLGTAFIGASYIFYPGSLLLSAVTGAVTSLYTLALASRLTGLAPNEKLFSSKVFSKYLLANSLVTIPLLILSINHRGGWIFPAALVTVFSAALWIIRGGTAK
ncbi:MAG: hypothetical protein ABEJ98_01235 [Candidatus Nanohaloarchaea archaeon]